MRELTTVTVSNTDKGNYYLKITNPKTLLVTTTVAINVNASASAFQTAVSPFYSYYGSITVTMVMFDIDDVVTTSLTTSVRNVYTITLNKAITGFTTNSIKATTSGTTTATVTVGYPTAVQVSSAPLRGNFTIKCYNSDGTSNTTREMPYNTGHQTYTNNYGFSVYTLIIEACPEYRNRIDVSESSTYSYMDDGRDIYIRFVGVARDPTQFTI